MRTITTLRNQILTEEECNALEDRTRKLLLWKLLTELGYNILKMQRWKWKVNELEKMVIQSIRQLQADKEKALKKLQILAKIEKELISPVFEFARKKMEEEK